MFIVIVGAAVAGIIGMIAMATQSSADPLIRKQALSIAEAMLEEVRLQPFTICDADETAGAAGASGSVQIGSVKSAPPGSGGNSTLTVSSVNFTGQNAVVVFVGYDQAGSGAIVEWVKIDPGGANETLFPSALAVVREADDAAVEIFGLVNPPQGTFNVEVKFTVALPSISGSNAVVYALSGVDTSDAFPATHRGTNKSAAGTGSVSVASAAGELVLAAFAIEDQSTASVDNAPPAVEDLVVYSGTSESNLLATAHQLSAGSSVALTWTNPSDHWAAAGLSVKPGSGCTDAIGPETILGVTETRYSVPLFDHVNDYHGFDSNTASLTGIRNIDGELITGLDGYRVTVDVAAQPLGGIGNDAEGKPQSLLITVTVTGPGNTTVVVSGYRTRYAPNALP